MKRNSSETTALFTTKCSICCFEEGPIYRGIEFLKMTTCDSDIPVADDFDAAMAITDVDMFQNDTDILLEVNSVVKHLPSAKKSGQVHCHIQNLPIRIRIVETCKIKTSRQFAVQ